MTEPKNLEEQQEADPFMRAVTSYNSKLLGHKEAILTDMQVLSSARGVKNFSSKVEDCLKRLADVDSKLSSMQKTFAKENNGEKKENS